MLEDYLQELQKITLLQPEEEAALWQAYKEGGDAGARSRLIEQYQPLVFKEAMRWNIHTDLLLDALQEGTLGLMEAVERYDPQPRCGLSLICCSSHPRGYPRLFKAGRGRQCHVPRCTGRTGDDPAGYLVR